MASCKGPQRYKLAVYYTSNHTHVGHVLAEEADGSIFSAVVANSDPDDQPYFGDWSFSAAPQDHNNVYLYLPPGQEGVIYDTYYLALYGYLNDTELTISSRQESGQQFTYYFHVAEDPKTHVLSFTIPEYHKAHTFTVIPSIEDSHPIKYLEYVESDKVPSGNIPVYLKAVKAC